MKKEKEKMIVVNVDYVPDKELEVVGLVQGVGESISLQEATERALIAMQEEGNKLKADAIVNTRIDSVMGTHGIQTLAYGTAVKYRVCYELQQF